MRWSLETEDVFEEAKLRGALERLPEGVLRLKGTVRCSGQARQLLVQCVGARRTVSQHAIDGTGHSRLVAIGLKTEVSPDQLDELFRLCCEQ